MSKAQLEGADNPQPQAVEPEMPKGMARGARREWKRMVPLLLTNGLLSSVDGSALAGYCRCAAMVELLDKELQHDGTTFREMYEDRDGNMVPGNIKPNPAYQQWLAAQKQMKSFLIEFGLTPASRRNLKVQKRDEGDEMENYMNGKTTPAPALAFVHVAPEDITLDDEPEKVEPEIES